MPVPARSWHAIPTNAPVKFGSPGAVASSDRMLASNTFGSQCHSSAPQRQANSSRSKSTSTRSSIGPGGTSIAAVKASAATASGSADMTRTCLPRSSRDT